MSLQNILPSTLRESVLARSIAAYSSISWLLLQVVSTFISGLGLPDWVFTGFLVILLAGIPVLLLAARSAARRSDPAHENRPPLRLGKITFKRAALGGSVAIALWVSLVGAFMASWALGIGPAASLLAAGSIKTSDAVLLAEFENRTTDPLLGRTVAEAIRVDLSQSNIIRVVDPVDVKEALERMKKPADSPLDDATARELSLREGIAAVLEGEVSALGPATIITVRLVDARHGSVLAEYQERAREPAELLDAVDRLSGTLRNKIGEPLTKIRVEPPLAKVTTTSVEALRDYTKANIAHGEGKKSSSIALLFFPSP